MASSSLPPLLEYTTAALKEYHQHVPDDMDWDIYEACAISVKEQRQRTGDPDNKDGVAVLTYGEINFECFAEVLYNLKAKNTLPEGTCCVFNLSSQLHALLCMSHMTYMPAAYARTNVSDEIANVSSHIEWSGTIWYDMVWYDMIRYGMI